MAVVANQDMSAKSPRLTGAPPLLIQCCVPGAVT